MRTVHTSIILMTVLLLMSLTLSAQLTHDGNSTSVIIYSSTPAEPGFSENLKPFDVQSLIPAATSLLIISNNNAVQSNDSILQTFFNEPIVLKISWYFLVAIILIVISMAFMLARWRTNVIRRQEATKASFEKIIMETEMSSLRAQMNPHFIFNSLNSINKYILMADRDTASFYLTKFSKLIRLILENSNKARISLDQELNALKHYIDMELLRFDHSFSYNIEIGADVDPVNIQFPPLIIQPYVENSIWHGFPRRGSFGIINITIKKEAQDILKITIEDNGVGRNMKKTILEPVRKKKHGLKITEDRLSILSKEGHPSSVEIIDLKNESNEPAGTKVIIKLSLSINNPIIEPS